MMIVMSRRLDRARAALVVIDVQEKLARHIHEMPAVQLNIERMARGARALGVPVVATEQYPQGIGSTVAAVADAVKQGGVFEPIQKMTFSCQDSEEFRAALGSAGQILLCGIEAHVCVYQTGLDLLDAGLSVHLVTDAISSRDPRNRQLAIDRLSSEGAKLTSTEMALFELTRSAGTDEFRMISRLVK